MNKTGFIWLFRNFNLKQKVYFHANNYFIFLKEIICQNKIYLIFTKSSSNISSTESNVNICIGKVWSAIDRLMTIWKSNLSDKINWELFQAVIVSVLLYGCTTWTLMKQLEKKLNGNYVLFWTNPGSSTQQKQQLYSHLLTISQTRQARHTGHD